MTSYNPKDWIQFIFFFSKGDTFRKLAPIMFLIGAYSAAIGYLEIEYWHLPDDSHVKNISMMHSMLGFVISLLLAAKPYTPFVEISGISNYLFNA
jgi:putative membrane protein